MPDFKQGLSVFKIDSFILDLIIKSNSNSQKAKNFIPQQIFSFV